MIDCATIAGEDAFIARVEELIDEVHHAPTADGADRIYVPGEIEWEKLRCRSSRRHPLAI